VTQTVPGVAARAASWYAALPPRRRELAQDGALGLGLAVLNLLSLLPYQSQMHRSWLALFLVVAQCLPLVARRRWPLAALILCGIPRNLYDTLGFGYAPLPLGPVIAFATVMERSRPWVRWTTVAGTCGGLAWGQATPGHTEPYDAVIQVFIFGAALVVGTLSRYRREAVAATDSRAARAEAALDEAAARAAAAERVRIARELHDVVAHHVSLMAVQAEAVGALLPGRPGAAAASADLIGSTARAAMTELRRLLGVLRFSGAPAEAERGQLSPAPSLARLDELIDAIRDAGLPVTHEVHGQVTALPPGIDLTAYRILQEALTNALRHAPGSSATVRVSYAATELTVEVTNTAPGAPAGPAGGPAPAAVLAAAVTPGTVVPSGAAVPPGTVAVPALTAVTPLSARGPATAALAPGYGLAGIAERIASCGGFLALGPAAGDGFTVTARLPLV
jgi:signal transduction histidine kinase